MVAIRLASAAAPKCRGYELAVRHLRQPRPQVMPNADYAKVCYPAQFKYRRRKLPDRPEVLAWQQWQEGDRNLDGLRLYPPGWYDLSANLGW